MRVRTRALRCTVCKGDALEIVFGVFFLQKFVEGVVSASGVLTYLRRMCLVVAL